MSKSILVVDDEPAIREMLRFALSSADFEVLQAEDAESARNLIAETLPDLVLLDWMLPGRSGIELAQNMRRDARTKEVPIIMLTAKSEENDKVRALRLGADDYVTKPFSVRELLARIQAVLRRAAPDGGKDLLTCNGLTLDIASHRVTANGALIGLGPIEFKLLKFLMAHPERVYSRSAILDHVWGSGTYIEDRTVDVHIRRLRKALTPVGYQDFVQTVRGAGYRFSMQT